jgi:predicted GNAT family acetyltransferase
METALVYASMSNTAARSLYESSGFHPTRTIHTYHRTIQ